MKYLNQMTRAHARQRARYTASSMRREELSYRHRLRIFIHARRVHRLALLGQHVTLRINREHRTAIAS